LRFRFAGNGQALFVSATSSALAALGTMESLVARLGSTDERDEVIAKLIAAIEQDRAELLAAVISAQAIGRAPRRLRTSADR
jgi:hypothetical protein